MTDRARLRRPRRRWFVHVAWMSPDGVPVKVSYRFYSEAFPWFTARDRIARAAYHFVREQAGSDDFAIVTLTFRPNRGRKAVPPYGLNAAAGQLERAARVQ